MKKTQSQTDTENLQKLITHIESESGDVMQAVNDIDQFHKWFKKFIQKHSTKILELIHALDVEADEKAYFEFLICHDLFEYEHFQELREKLVTVVISYDKTEKQIDAEMKTVRDLKKVQFDIFIKNLQSANQSFEKKIETIVETEVRSMESKKRSAEKESMEQIKQKLKK